MFQAPHAILPDATHDEFAREEFCGTLRKFFTETLWPGNNDVYKGQQLPTFVSRHGREPASRDEVKSLMEETFYYRCSNLFGRVAQEQLWDIVGESVERQLPELIAKAAPKPDAKGSVEVDEDIDIPAYIDAVDIHVMPGNFHTELAKNDVYAGALYDRGVYYFSYGGMGERNDQLGVAMVDYIKERFPDFAPRRILDVGCGPGFSTLPWKEAFPDAEVHGIDISAPMVRYAHARAESWGVPVHFAQRNAADTRFADDSFDLVTSCLLYHEVPVKVLQAYLREAFRILAPGGIVLGDGGNRPKPAPDRELFLSWFNNNVNEPFATGLKRLDYRQAHEDAGFDPDGFFFSGDRPPVYLKGMHQNKPVAGGGIPYVGSRKPA